MTALRLRFCDDSHPDLPLETGVHALARQGDGLVPVASDEPWLLQLCHDRRGLWMTVAPGVRGVHVNGRPVQQLAMLRPGDCIHVEGRELLLIGARRDAAPLPRVAAAPADPCATALRLALRGIGGDHHGRSLSLERPRRVGSAAGVDLHLEGHGIAPEQAVLEPVEDQVLLHRTASEVMVNGTPVRQALLQAGDQIVFGGRHRFVLEGPPPTNRSTPSPPPSASPTPAPPHWTQRVPWLLVAALLLAAALWALLVFGAR
ncbi:FHA domain-containing protein [Thermomonas alba]|uniref:FHA domain-containing protein n=1 Tax=Thermomonas alba TaxID=2888525 RepID=UPI001F0502F8|nr:FHA domain-containing protein [Thermomonas alba]